MTIYSMTATFGKLEHETLTLQPGLNIIDRPNEWGKSTWCAFLITMLYGLDTRAKSTRSILADKDRYVPWSGSPMAGRIDLNWNGRDITIERSSKGRIPMGEFRAYETESGLPVPELTAYDCGKVLLGVERSVFTRAGFIRLTDMPVTQDDALRRRLNALVSTGDESGAGEKLAHTLKELKNRCRYNRTGLLPQAEAEAEELEKKLEEIHRLRSQKERLIQRQGEVEERLAQLENHRIALRYHASCTDTQRVEQARQTRQQEQERLLKLEAECRDLPPREQQEQDLWTLQSLNEQFSALEMEMEMMPPAPDAPQAPASFQSMTPQQALQKAEEDRAVYEKLQKNPSIGFFAVGAVALVAALILGILRMILPALCCAAAFAALMIAGDAIHRRVKRQRKQIQDRYPDPEPMGWLDLARGYEQDYRAYERSKAAHDLRVEDLQKRMEAVEGKRRSLTGGDPAGETAEKWGRELTLRDECADLRRNIQRMDTALATLEELVKPAPAPEFPDVLTYTEAETARLHSDSTYEQRQLQLQLGKCEGMIEALGSEAPLEDKLLRIRGRIRQLEQTYHALDYAQKALNAASQELQRRFAPRIAKRTQELFGALTAGRYQRMTLGEDLTLSAAAEGEDTLHTALWRSDGTVDQLYLALRLAVAEELTPDAPVVLDDALVRFDRERLAAAMKALQNEAERKQVILFTCHSREQELR